MRTRLAIFILTAFLLGSCAKGYVEPTVENIIPLLPKEILTKEQKKLIKFDYENTLMTADLVVYHQGNDFYWKVGEQIFEMPIFQDGDDVLILINKKEYNADWELIEEFHWYEFNPKKGKLRKTQPKIDLPKEFDELVVAGSYNIDDLNELRNQYRQDRESMLKYDVDYEDSTLLVYHKNPLYSSAPIWLKYEYKGRKFVRRPLEPFYTSRWYYNDHQNGVCYVIIPSNYDYAQVKTLGQSACAYLVDISFRNDTTYAVTLESRDLSVQESVFMTFVPQEDGTARVTFSDAVDGLEALTEEHIFFGANMRAEINVEKRSPEIVSYLEALLPFTYNSLIYEGLQHQLEVSENEVIMIVEDQTVGNRYIQAALYKKPNLKYLIYSVNIVGEDALITVLFDAYKIETIDNKEYISFDTRNYVPNSPQYYSLFFVPDDGVVGIRPFIVSDDVLVPQNDFFYNVFDIE